MVRILLKQAYRGPAARARVRASSRNAVASKEGAHKTMTHAPDTTRSTAATGVVVPIVVFASGAIVMVLELVGSRLLAPFFGNSLFVWTSLIGVMLAFMALGGYVGGRLADRRLSTTILFWILLGASASISVVALAERSLLSALAEGPNLRVAAVLSAAILFAIPSMLLGAVSPYCTRLRLHALADSGATVGSLYALSTFGSIVGTFAAGFWLIATVGSHELISWLAVGVLALSLLVAMPLEPRRIAALAGGLALVLLAMFASSGYDGSFDTQYDRYFIGMTRETETDRAIVTLARDDYSIESATYVDTGEPYLLDYYGYYDLALASVPDRPAHASDRRRGLLVPAASAAGAPRFHCRRGGDRPDLVEVARSTFSLTADPRLEVIVRGRPDVPEPLGRDVRRRFSSTHSSRQAPSPTS